MPRSLLNRLDAGDRALFLRWALHGGAPRRSCRAWRAITHLGGATFALTATVVPLAFDGALHEAAARALVVLIVSHVVVQAVKRTVGRPRPSRGMTYTTLIGEPDRFSFPSGHAAAAMSLAIGYASVFPALTACIAPLAVVVGFSRVALAVHFPGDVVAGQMIALATAAVFWLS